MSAEQEHINVNAQLAAMFGSVGGHESAPNKRLVRVVSAAATYQTACDPNVVVPVQCSLEEDHREDGSKQHFRPTKHLQKR